VVLVLVFAPAGHATPPKEVSVAVALTQLGAQARDLVSASQRVNETAFRTIEAGRPMELSNLESGLEQLERDIVDLDKLLAQAQRAWTTQSP